MSDNTLLTVFVTHTHTLRDPSHSIPTQYPHTLFNSPYYPRQKSQTIGPLPATQLPGAWAWAKLKVCKLLAINVFTLPNASHNKLKTVCKLAFPDPLPHTPILV